MSGFTAADVPDQSDKTIVITGANSGIGFEAAKVLAGKGARVLLGSRDMARGEAARDLILDAHAQAEVEVLQIDLSDLGSVKSAAGEIGSLDILINNAGIMMPPLGFTQDGFEQQIGINHFGHFALTALLLPKMQQQQARGARVVTVSSIAHRRGKIDFANLDAKKGYSAIRFYAQSKLANLLFMQELDRRLRAAGSAIASIGCHPGVAGTSLGRHSFMQRTFFPLASKVLNTPEAGAWPTLQAACDPTAKSGEYFGSQGFLEMRGLSGRAKISAHAKNEDLARRLWDVSAKLTGFNPDPRGSMAVRG